MDQTERILRQRYCPETLNETTPEKSGVVVYKAALPELSGFETFGEWLAACEASMLGYPPKLKELVVKQALANYVKEAGQ
ncbi:hypothetical protein [Pseudomonas sp. BN411]|uniref:hypothetical protein n=1 Tax=Pseudomonas sp. BN411 TaxID=2567887 RepID=UPI002457CAB3|nr:hypothetical protein [Pseudomonas sp. BN411]MDH4562152.1 hypothetical protein [Pseudomonas sp. BN411]